MDTSASLLERLRHPSDHDAWRRFVELYTPLLHFWAKRAGLESADAADLVQDVFTRLVAKLPDFQYDPGKSFRGWLHAVLINLWHDRASRRSPNQVPIDINGLPQPESAPNWEEADYRRQLLSRALPLIQHEFPAATWQAFVGYAIEGRSAKEIAESLQTTVNAVYLAKSRVIRRLRQELAGLIE